MFLQKFSLFRLVDVFIIIVFIVADIHPFGTIIVRMEKFAMQFVKSFGNVVRTIWTVNLWQIVRSIIGYDRKIKFISVVELNFILFPTTLILLDMTGQIFHSLKRFQAIVAWKQEVATAMTIQMGQNVTVFGWILEMIGTAGKETLDESISLGLLIDQHLSSGDIELISMRLDYGHKFFAKVRKMMMKKGAFIEAHKTARRLICTIESLLQVANPFRELLWH